MINIAIDGFSGSGKSTLARLLAAKLDNDFKVLDTGAIFRAFAYAYENGCYGDLRAKKIQQFLDEIELKVEFVGDEQHMWINGVDITPFIRTQKIGQLASKISVFPEIRERYLQIAKSFAKEYNCIMEGRDIGTVVMPNADVKIFLTADEQTRAKRRFDELVARKLNPDLKKVLKELRERDEIDTTRAIAPLVPTEESVIVDNSEMSLFETADYCAEIVEKMIKSIKKISIAIDGYVCSGKSTIAKSLAKRLDFRVFDTGAVYRGMACAFDYMNYDEKQISEKYVCSFANQINIKVEFIDGLEHVFVNGIDYTQFLRTERASALSAKISPFTCVRNKVLNLQRDFAKFNNVVMEGRDIGSFVLPKADFKFFCTADEQVRAKRRFEQQKALGNDVSFENVLKELKERDFKDIHREHGAIKILPSSIIVDTTNQGLEESVGFCLEIIKKKFPDIEIY